jgi:uncharacterized protein YfaS (alpha-2-macroglobulin family)
MRKIFFISAAIVWTIGFYSCSKKSLDEFLSDFSLYEGYIESFSSGYVSVYDPITIVFAQDLSGSVMKSGPDENWFDISPSVDGEVKFLDNNTIVFTPSEKLKQDQEYRITFKLNEVMDVPKELGEFRFAVHTYKQDFIVNVEDVQSYDRNWQYLRGSIQTTDIMEFDIASQLVTAEQDGEKLNVKVVKEHELSRVFNFVIDSVQRKTEDSKVIIYWDGKPFKIDQKDQGEFEIPGKNNFKVIQIEVENGDEQFLKINFSDPLEKNQNLKGLVRIEDASNLRYSMEGNILYVYLSEVLSGTKTVQVFQGIRSVDGMKMKKDFRGEVLFEELLPNVRMVRSGVLLPSSQNLKINFEAVNLSAVDVLVYRIHSQNVLQFLQVNEFSDNEGMNRVGSPVAKTTIKLNHATPKAHQRWNAYALDLSKIMKPDPGAVYRVELSIRPEYSMYPCDTPMPLSENNDKPFNPADYDQRSGYDGWDEYYDDDYWSWYDWEQIDNPCHRTYFYEHKAATNVIATDLGVIAKRGEDGSYVFAVTDIVSTNPVAGASVELYTFDQQLLTTLKTNGEGIATWKSDRYAYFALVKKDKQVTPVKLAENISNSMSAFNVSGERLHNGMNGYIYGERGVWRPGDTLFIGFILNNRHANPGQKSPVKLSIYNARGIMVHQDIANHSNGQHYKFVVPTSADAETGNWEAVIQVGGATFRKGIFIETIKPNRLKVKTAFVNKVLTANNKNAGKMVVTWLHGALAKDLKVDLSVKYSRMITAFKGYEKFLFDDPARSFDADETVVFEGRLNDKGEVAFDIIPDLEQEAPGMLRAVFMARAFEKGGDFSSDVLSTTVSPYKRYVGFRPTNMNKYGYMETGGKSTFEVVTLSPNGKPVAAKNLQVRVYKLDYYWWYDATADYLSRYTSTSTHVPFKMMNVSTNSSGKGNFSFEVGEYDYGRYLVRVYDPEHGHASGQLLDFSWPAHRSFGRSKKNESDEATKLVFLTDKSSYNVGETMKITFPSSQNGRAFVSLENATSVLQHQWVQTAKNETVVSIPVTADMAPNVFVHITMIQPHANTINDAPIRLYGVQPVDVVNKETILEPTINMPSSLKPEEKFTVEVGERNGQAMTYTLAIVDEGLLDLTRFKTPNAWKSFYSRQALGVRTWDMFDHVIGAFGGKIAQIFSIGGDEDLGKSNPKKPNRFKPVVMYLGPFELKPGEKQKHSIEMPNYIGSVRTMVVASNSSKYAYGSAENTTPVKKPLMLLASAPRQVSPEERISLPVTVFAMENHVKNVKLTIQTSGNIKLNGNNKQSLVFNQPDDKVVYFDLEVGAQEGAATIRVMATSGSEKAYYEFKLNVGNPNPPTYEIHDVLIEPGLSQRIDFETFGIQGSNVATLELSVMPPMNLDYRLGELISYPHGCLEQITSRVFPQLFLSDLVSLDQTRIQKIQTHINAGIRKLQHFQLPNGGFGYWPGAREANLWGSSYVGHFLLEAEKKGYQLPVGFKKKWITFQKNAAKNWQHSLSTENDFDQAYRLYTLALAGSADVSSMNRLKSIVGISSNTKLRLAAAYVLVGQKDAALQLIKSANIENLIPKSNYYFDSRERNNAMALETFVLLKDKTKARKMANLVALSLSSKEYMSTQTSAYSIVAMGEFAKLIGGSNFSATYMNNGKSVKVSGAKPLTQNKLVVQRGKNSVDLKNTSGATIFARIVVQGVLPLGSEKSFQRGLTLNITYRDASGMPVIMSKIQQGTDVIAEIRIQNSTNNRVDNVALTHIIPGGFEIVNARFTEYGGHDNAQIDYLDIRDDRSNYYFSLDGFQSKTFTVRISAAFPGRYYFPGAQADAMYDNNFSVRTTGRWIEILKY